MRNFVTKKINLPFKAFIIGLCIASGSALSQTLPLPENLISFNSRDGEQLLLESKYRQDYWPLSIQFVTQVNYLRNAIGQEKGGHISPLAAYNEQTDRFLILDVSRYKYPPVWVKAADLWQAMATVDSSVNKTRGFVLISKF